MKKNLTWRETISITSMLFGMFFGAGNLICPALLGQMAGRNIWGAALGFLVTGVGLPLLGVAALGVTHSEGVAPLSQRAGKGYGTFFTCALYLTIGPFFAIPRCATVPFEMSMAAMLPEGYNAHVFLAVFTLIFFGIVLFFSLRPGKILETVGKILTPIFLVVLGVLVITALVKPMGSISQIEPEAAYASNAFFRGFLEGYNTMDALAGLAFGIVVVRVIRDQGVTEPGAVAANTVRAGIFSCVFMGVIYLAVTIVAVQSRAVYPLAANGGAALGMISHHYFGKVGTLLLAMVFVAACLKTAVGLITSCSENFATMTNGKLGYRFWAVLFCVVSLLIANQGLTTIMKYSLPVLMFLYPLAITLILLALFGRLWDHDTVVYRSVTVFTLISAIPELFAILPESLQAALRLDRFLELLKTYVPFYGMGLGWVLPAVAGLVIGLIWWKCKGTRPAAQ